MAVTSELEPINRYNGNGASTVFAYTFKIFVESDLFVSPIAGVTQIINTHYTVSGVGSPTGGNVTFLTAPPTGTGNVVFSLDLPFTQQTQYPFAQKFPSTQVEQDFDRAVLRDLVLFGLTGRAVLLPIAEVATVLNRQMPALADRISKFFAWDASGNIIAAAGTSANLGPVSGFINTLLDDADAATARATLGISSLSTSDADFRVTGSGDSTKKLAFEVDSITTATTRTRFVSDEDANDAQGWDIKNLNVEITVAANAVTIAIKTKGGADPSATSPVIIKYRNATLTTGDYALLTITAALSVTITNGSTLGTVSAVPHRIYFGVANDGGTARLFAYNPLSSALNLRTLQDYNLASSTAEGGAGAADSAQVLYSATAFTSKAVRILGYFESTQATAGVWATSPSKKHILRVGDKRTGDIVQHSLSMTGAASSGTTTIPADDTIQQNTEGNEFMSVTIVPTSDINLLHIKANAICAGSIASNTQFRSSLFQDSVADAFATTANWSEAGGRMVPLINDVYKQALTTSSITFKLRAGLTTAGTITFNGTGGAREAGGVMNSYLDVIEIFV